MAACGMEQCSRAMQKATSARAKGSVTVRLAAKLRGRLHFRNSKDGMSSLRAKATAQSSVMRR